MSIVPMQSLLAEQLIQSAPHRVHLVELYTSEGCSSCPPADRWMSSMRQHESLWSSFVPIAFHVDYWDYIGWPDRFASPRYSRRQRDHAKRGGARTVYTPGFFLDGKEWRTSFRARALKAASSEQVGVLSLHVAADSALQVRYQPAEGMPAPDQLLLNLALLGFDLQSEVEAGENSGRTLKHDFTVLAWREEVLRARDGEYALATSVPESPHVATRKALAAWLSRLGELRPIQAAGGFLP